MRRWIVRGHSTLPSQVKEIRTTVTHFTVADTSKSLESAHARRIGADSYVARTPKTAAASVVIGTQNRRNALAGDTV